MELSINLVKGAKPFERHNRLLNPNQEKDLQKQMDAWKMTPITLASSLPLSPEERRLIKKALIWRNFTP